LLKQKTKSAKGKGLGVHFHTIFALVKADFKSTTYQPKKELNQQELERSPESIWVWICGLNLLGTTTIPFSSDRITLRPRAKARGHQFWTHFYPADISG